MGSGYVHEVDVAHIEERGHNIQLWEYLQQVLFLTPDCIAETIKRLLGPEVAHLADRYGVETERGRAFCLAITLGAGSVPVMIVARKTPRCLKTLTVYPYRGANHNIKSQLAATAKHSSRNRSSSDVPKRERAPTERARRNDMIRATPTAFGRHCQDYFDAHRLYSSSLSKLYFHSINPKLRLKLSIVMKRDR